MRAGTASCDDAVTIRHFGYIYVVMMMARDKI